MPRLFAIQIDPNTPSWIVLTILSLLFFLFSLWAWRFRRFLARLFAKHQFDEPTLKDVQERVDLIDQECPRFSFAAERVANMSFRGKKVSIICGPVAWSDAFTHSNKCVYAIVDADESQWMQKNSDVFEPAFTGSHDSVFWVNIPELLRQTKT
jgi:hypothetical protein